MEVTKELEVRKLSPKYRATLVRHLEDENDWKKLMCNIPEILKKNVYESKISEFNLPRYNSDHIRIIERVARTTNRSPADILFDEWSTTGRVRPCLGHVFYLLNELQIIQAAKYIASLINENAYTSSSISLTTGELEIINDNVSCGISERLQNMTYPSDISNQLQQSNPSMLSGNLPSERSLNTENIQNIPDFNRINASTDSDLDEDTNSLMSNNEYTSLRNLCFEGSIVDPFPAIKRYTESAPGRTLSLNTPLRHFGYSDLKSATNNFDTSSNDTINGRFLGRGGYGSVYLALGLQGEPVAAVKKIELEGQMLTLQEHILNSFKTEVENLYKFKHENLVSLLGYSCDGPSICLVYEYISGGNLKSQLEVMSMELNCKDRIEIALGISKAIYYLHTSNPEQPFIHRDIKTANILLDANKKAKLCDFGTARLSKHTTSHTRNVCGTGPYMSPEGNRGDVSVKLDTFSFGVVLLELLTGLPPFDCSRSSYDLLSYVRDCLNERDENIKDLLDKNVNDWQQDGIDFGFQLYRICKKCVEDAKTDRPFMINVKDQLEILLDQVMGKKDLLLHFSYNALREATNNFESKGNNEEEYLAIGLFNKPTIVKRLTLDGHSTQSYELHLRSFKAEVEKVCQLQHENLVALLGYCCEYPNYCLIFEYIEGDRLLHRLKDSQRPIPWEERLDIAVRVSRSISYLHTIMPEKPYVHFNIRSVNIILYSDGKAKLSLGRLFKNSSPRTSTISEPDPYISPEATRGDISVKADTFSFGIVLLELLTGLAPLDHKRSTPDLLSFVNKSLLENQNDILHLLDTHAGDWISDGTNFGKQIYNICVECFKVKSKRLMMIDLKEQLESLQAKIQQTNGTFMPALSLLMENSNSQY